jgi:protein phosphatase
MEQSSALEVFSRSDQGRVREANEDCVYAGAREGLLIVADGMGGHAGGEVASAIAVRVIARSLQGAFGPEAGFAEAETRRRLCEACRRADEAIRERAAADPALAGMGTTVVIALCRPRSFVVAHAGDSRAYLLRRGRLHLLTEDHTLVQRLVEAGAIPESAARRHHLRNVITRCLGGQEYEDPDVAFWEWDPGEVLLLCSDGLTGMLEDQEIEAILLASRDLEACGNELIRAANERGGTDNISVVLARWKEV